MNKIEKMIMSFAAVALIVGFSAFKSNEKKLVDVTYYQTSLDNYEKLTSPTGTCDPTQEVDHPCTLTFSSDKGAGFTWSTRPSGGSPSPTNRIYEQ